MYKQYTESNGNSIKFSLSNADKGAVGLILAQELANLTTRICLWFSSVFVFLYSHLLYFMKVIIFYFVFYPLFSNVVFFGGMSYTPLYFCIFSHKKYAKLLSCCAFCSLAIYIVSFSLFLLSISMFEHFHLQYSNLQHLKHLTSCSFSFLTFYCLIHHLPSLLYITLLANISNLFWGLCHKLHLVISSTIPTVSKPA